MPDNVQRLQYSELQVLRQPDFDDEQNYHRDMRYRHNRYSHTKGILDEMTVTQSGDRTVMVAAGTAFDGEGRELVFVEPEPIDLAPFNRANITSYLVIFFRELDADGPIPDPNPAIRNRTEERPEYNLVDVQPVASDIPVWLAEIDFDNSGIITAVRDRTTLEEIPDSGARVARGSISLENLDEGLQNALILALAPEIGTVNPTQGRGGPDPTEVTITGGNFIEPFTVEFSLGNVRTPAELVDSFENTVTEIQVTVPDEAPLGPGFIFISTAFGVARSPTTFLVTAP